MSDGSDGENRAGTSTREPSAETRESSETAEESPETDDPFAELEAPEGSEISPEELDDFFEPVETTELDDEAVWEAVLSPDDEDEPIEAETGADAVVPKNQYCKQCEFFSEPPDVTCTNPGTKIEELVGTDEFRVTNCPVVARRGRAKDVFNDKK
jgi:hypothetical protein